MIVAAAYGPGYKVKVMIVVVKIIINIGIYRVTIKAIIPVLVCRKNLRRSIPHSAPNGPRATRREKYTNSAKNASGKNNRIYYGITDYIIGRYLHFI